MKKNFVTPSLEMKSFNKELILQDSTVPTMTNEEAAKAALNSADVTVNQVAVITL